MIQKTNQEFQNFARKSDKKIPQQFVQKSQQDHKKSDFSHHDQ